MTRALMMVAALTLGAAACSRDVPDSSGPDYSSYPLAAGAAIDLITLAQGTEIVLHNPVDERGGRFAPPIVPGRDAVVRVFVSPVVREEFSGRTLAVVLRVTGPSGERRMSEQVVVWGSWLRNSLRTTANFRIPGDWIDPERFDLEVSVHETIRFDYSAGEGADEEALTWSSADDPLRVEPSGPVTLHVVPIQYNGDGSGRVPNMSGPAMAAIRATFFATYPITDLRVVEEDVLPYDGVVTAGGGWEALLSRIVALRAEAAPAENAYFYGLFLPAPSFEEFCGGGCTVGLSSVPTSPFDSWARTSIGLGYLGTADDTLVHEVGHAHGRMHAPCGNPPGPDGRYPYGGGGIGSWGYDIVLNEVRDPSVYTDMMGYCSPTWISDYTFSALHDWIVEVEALRSASTVTEWTLLTVAPDGLAEIGPVIDAPVDAGGEPAQFELLDVNGAVVAVQPGWTVPLDHSDGALALLPPVGPEVASARLRR